MVTADTYKQAGVVAEEAMRNYVCCLARGDSSKTMRGFARKLGEIFTLRANTQFYATLCACCVHTSDRSKVHWIQNR